MRCFGSALVMCLLAIAVGTPIGIARGYLSWPNTRTDTGSASTAIRFVNDILLSAPSIVLGLFIYTLVVRADGAGSQRFAGALALTFIVAARGRAYH